MPNFTHSHSFTAARPDRRPPADGAITSDGDCGGQRDLTSPSVPAPVTEPGLGPWTVSTSQPSPWPADSEPGPAGQLAKLNPGRRPSRFESRSESCGTSPIVQSGRKRSLLRLSSAALC
jgi:hypothetical protein